MLSAFIQGPFRADVMQKWHDDGYFTPDLLMKRTNLDNDWTPVGELMRRAGGGKLFLTPPAPSLPPGLIRRTDSPQHAYPLPPEQSFNGPFQPAPMRSLRSTTLDTYFGTGSNPSDSPASSFGARFSNGSPDPSAFGGRANQYAAGEIGDRFGGFPLNDSPARRSTFGDGFVDSRTQGFGNSYNVNGAYTTNASPWPTSNLNMGATFETMNNGRGSAEFQAGYSPHLGSGSGSVNAPYTDALGNNAYRDYGGFSAGGQHTLAQTFNNRNVGGMPFSDTNQQQYSASSFPAQQQFTSIPETFDQQAARAPAQTALNVQEPVISSPWGVVEHSVPKLPGPFDAIHPTSANTVPNHTPTPPQPSAWGTPSQLYKQNMPISDIVSPQTSIDSVKEEIESNIVATGQLAGSSAEMPFVIEPKTEVETSVNEIISPLEPVPEPIPPVAVPVPAPVTTTKSKEKSQQSALATAPPTEIPAAPVPVSPSSPQPPVMTPSKAPWAKDEDSKKTATSLREIQDAEAKKVEARKAAEREREKERAARAAVAAAAAEDVQPFTASWGLPTSQAGKVSAAPQPKETAASVAATPTTPPVWTQAAKPAATKKTMKEIQEEEERRKKTAIKETTAGMASRRGYAESTTKVS